jgi:hypothetical protein
MASRYRSNRRARRNCSRQARLRERCVKSDTTGNIRIWYLAGYLTQISGRRAAKSGGRRGFPLTGFEQLRGQVLTPGHGAMALS